MGGNAPPPKAEGAWEPLLERELSERTADNRESDYLPEVAASSRHQHSVLTSGRLHRPRSPEQGFPSGGARRGGHDEH